MDTKKIRVRIAPSPTGYAHVGTAYTALLNYAFARSNKGAFVVRIEDSDLKRNLEGSEKKIYEGLEWLGIDWDEGVTRGGEYGPYKLSDKLEVYKKYAKHLVEKGLAYEDGGAIRFKNPGEEVGWIDAVRGEITFPGEEITDFVIMKSDGYPTYNFAVVIDDIEMKITHVIRGEDHISNTPRQIALYRALKKDHPIFAHHPMLLNTQKKKLSKRDAAVDVMAYKKMGYLPDAFRNFLSLLGWSHPAQKEIFSLGEFVENFSLDRVRPSGAVFDIEKLLWMNGEYIKKLDDNILTELIFDFFDKKYSFEIIKQITPIVKERISTLEQFESLAGFFFETPQIDKDLYSENYNEHLSVAVESLESIEDWKAEKIGNELLNKCDSKGYHRGKFFMDLRVAVTGQKVTPPLNESLVILGKEETLNRIKSSLK